MKIRLHPFFVIFTVFLLGACSEEDSAADNKRDPAAQAVMQKHAEVTQAGVIADFVRALTAEHYEAAAAQLHPRLTEAWTVARFTQDWRDIRAQAGEKWGPEAMGTYSGISTQGAYDQATYRLLSDWRSLASVELVSMEVEGTKRIVKVHIRVPYRDAPPPVVASTTNAFVAALLRGDTGAAQELITPAQRSKYPADLLNYIRPLLGEVTESTTKTPYRFGANSVWYDAVRLTRPENPASFLELAMTRKNGLAQIVYLSFKGRP